MTDDTGLQATLKQALQTFETEESSGDANGISPELLLAAVDHFFDSTTDIDEQVAVLNALRERLHDRSPFSDPVENVKWVKRDAVERNEYNPNEVAPPELDLLHTSIRADGYTQPIVTYEIDAGEYEVVDGYHRMLIGQTRADIRDRLNDYVPVTVIDKPREERMASTIRHNRARGTHQIRGLSDVVAELYERGWDDERICVELGMELDEVIRLKQVSGLKAVFSGHEFSQSWTEYTERYSDKEAVDSE